MSEFLNENTTLAIITYIATAIVPLVGLVFTILTFINDKKKEAIHKEMTFNNESGDNYYIDIDNHTNMSLSKQEQKLTDFQENVNFIKKWFLNFSPLILVVIYGLHLYKTIIPFPDFGERGFLDATTFIGQSFLNAAVPSVDYFLILILSICLVLALKNLLAQSTNVLLALAYVALGLLYFYAEQILHSSSLQTFKIPYPSHLINASFSEFLSQIAETYTPLFSFLLLVFLWIVATGLILRLFETKLTLPNFRQLKNSLPRLAFFSFSIFLPLLIIFLSQYKEH